LSSPVTTEVLDFSQPVALILAAILHFIPDEFRPADILATLVDALPSGSYLVASQVSMEDNPALIGNAMDAYRAAGLPAQARDSGDFARLAFAGLDLVPPGVVLVSEWRQETDGPRPAPAELSLYGGVGRKP
jgi:S-adenosyl methyltransferase